ncbi:MAG TPA: carboxylating nicotinate-nucleotide diphosphorylase [Pseudomonadales bacterium]|nr:carboxylating nicotinate-nucleotide diphosphorylase [Pseudomonadales bacterium]
MFEYALDPATVTARVRDALAEDVGSGDITAQLIPAERRVRARVIARERGIVCGRPWVDETFRQLDEQVRLTWARAEGEPVTAEQTILELEGPARAIVTGERTALNFLQLLSGTATAAARFAQLVEGTGLRVLDTRKTLPGLRAAQKYAVACGGCHNHRMGLFDAFLIKENHIAAAGSIGAAVSAARDIAPGRPVEVEVESLAELDEAIAAGADVIMLDEFDAATMRAAVARTGGRAKLEVSGSVTAERIAEIAACGVDFVSVGGLTKHVQALDLSLRILA